MVVLLHPYNRLGGDLLGRYLSLSLGLRSRGFLAFLVWRSCIRRLGSFLLRRGFLRVHLGRLRLRLARFLVLRFRGFLRLIRDGRLSGFSLYLRLLGNPFFAGFCRSSLFHLLSGLASVPVGRFGIAIGGRFIGLFVFRSDRHTRDNATRRSHCGKLFRPLDQRGVLSCLRFLRHFFFLYRCRFFRGYRCRLGFLRLARLAGKRRGVFASLWRQDDVDHRADEHEHRREGIDPDTRDVRGGVVAQQLNPEPPHAVGRHVQREQPTVSQLEPAVGVDQENENQDIPYQLVEECRLNDLVDVTR